MQTNALNEIVELLAKQGFHGMAKAVAVLLNEVIKLERSHALGAAPADRRTKGLRHVFKTQTLYTGSGRSPSRCPRPVGWSCTPRAWGRASGASGR